MRKHLGHTFVIAALATLPSLAEAQRRPAAAQQPRQQEFGVDLGLAWYNEKDGEAGILFGSPLDVRVGFPSRSKLMWEGRVGLGFNSKGGVDTSFSRTTAYTFTPGVNVVYAMDRSSHRRGMYLTGGLGLNLIDVGAVGGAGFAFNAAVGWRKPTGGSALRYELGLRWESEIKDSGNTISPSTLNLGGRVGISFWR